MKEKVYSTNGKEYGLTTGSERRCPVESCHGRRLGVRWKDGKLTWPCTNGMKTIKAGHWQIL